MKFACVALVLGLTCALQSAADEAGGLHAEVTLGFGVYRGDDTTSGLGSIGLALRSQTRTQKLEFDFDATQISRIGTQGETTLGYTRKSKSSALEVKLGYGQRPRGSFAFSRFERGDYVDVSGANADEKTSIAELSFRTGIDRPLGLEFSLRHRTRETREANGIFQEGTRHAAKVVARADLNKRSSVKLRFGYDEFEGSGAINTRQSSRSFSIGIDQKIKARLTIGGTIGWRKLDMHGTASASGSEWRFGMTSQRKDGQVYARIARRLSGSGMLTQVLAGGSKDLKDGALKFELGVARLEGHSAEPTARVAYSKSYSKARFEVKLSRDFVGSDLAPDVRIATLGAVRLTQEIGPLSELDLQIDVVRSDGSANLQKRSMQQVRVAYQHGLTQDLQLVGGAFWRGAQDGAAIRTSTNGVFLRLERRFAGGL